jgi:putative oxidoreductase
MIAFGLLILRFVVGLTVASHGAQKLFGWFGGSGMGGWTKMVRQLGMKPAQPLAWVAALAEFAGGLAVALGFLSPLGSLAVAGPMVVAIAAVHLSKGFWNKNGGYEFPLGLLAAVTALALIGPGDLSLDRLLGTHLPEPLTLIAGTLALVVGVAASLGSRRLSAAGKPRIA